MSNALFGQLIVPMGRPLAQTANVMPLRSPLVLAMYFIEGILLIACSGGAVEFACASVVFEGSGVCPAAVRVLKWHPLTDKASIAAASGRRMAVPCMLASFHAHRTLNFCKVPARLEVPRIYDRENGDCSGCLQKQHFNGGLWPLR